MTHLMAIDMEKTVRVSARRSRNPLRSGGGAAARAGRIACGMACAWTLIAALPSFSQDASSEEAAPQAPAVGKDISVAFPKQVVRIQVEPGKESFSAEWAYTNPYELPMVVQELKSDCGCLVVEADHTKQVAKGESGKISADFSPGARRGLIRITLKIRFVGYDKPVKLILEAKIPAPVEVSTAELTWTAKNRNQAQSLDVTTGTSTDFQITDLTGLPEGRFTIKQETVKEKRHYRLHITPTSKAVPSVQYLQICTDARDPGDQLIEVHLRME